MGNRSAKIPVCQTWLDQLPPEIILEIFDYLRRNDIIYTFLFLDQRFHQLLLHQYPHYLSYLELPVSNLPFWQDILSIIGSKVQILKINENDRSISLKSFPNLQSIILSSPYSLAEKQIEAILQSQQFKHLHSLEIQSNEFYYTPSFYDYAPHQDHLLEKVISSENSLKTFKHSSSIRNFTNNPLQNLKANLHITSLTLTLYDFVDTFLFIDHTPNLKYLSIRSYAPYGLQGLTPWTNKNQIKLEKLCLAFNDRLYGTRFFTAHRIDFAQLIAALTHFSSSLWYLSLNLIGCYITSSNDLPFNGLQLQRQFLKPLTQLKEFHLYATLTQDVVNAKNILSTFRDQFWFDRNWTIAMHDKYLYTLPFHFHKLYAFTDFDDVHSNHPAILIEPRRLWDNVRFIRFKNFDLNLLPRIHQQMPKLLIISNDYFNPNQKEEGLPRIEKQADHIDVVFNHVTTIEQTCGSLENEKQWLMKCLPNLNTLILTHVELPLLKSELAFRFNETIERLVLDGSVMIEQFSNQSYIYFSNLQDLQIKFDWTFDSNTYGSHAELILRSLHYFKLLKTLSISYNRFIWELTRSAPPLEVKKIADKLNKSEIEKTFEIIYLRSYLIFSRKERVFT